MKAGQFMCLGNLQRLKNRFGNGYALRVKGYSANIDRLKDELQSMVPGLRMDGKPLPNLSSHTVRRSLFACRATQ